MAAITPDDWGRIYAFIWKDVRNGTGTYKTLFETDPNEAVKEIARVLKLLPDGVDIGPYDRLFDVDIPPPSDFSDAQLEAIMKGQADPNSFKFFFRLTC